MRTLISKNDTVETQLTLLFRGNIEILEQFKDLSDEEGYMYGHTNPDLINLVLSIIADDSDLCVIDIPEDREYSLVINYEGVGNTLIVGNNLEVYDFGVDHPIKVPYLVSPFRLINSHSEFVEKIDNEWILFELESFNKMENKYTRA